MSSEALSIKLGMLLCISKIKSISFLLRANGASEDVIYATDTGLVANMINAAFTSAKVDKTNSTNVSRNILPEFVLDAMFPSKVNTMSV